MLKAFSGASTSSKRRTPSSPAFVPPIVPRAPPLDDALVRELRTLPVDDPLLVHFRQTPADVENSTAKQLVEAHRQLSLISKLAADELTTLDRLIENLQENTCSRDDAESATGDAASLR